MKTNLGQIQHFHYFGRKIDLDYVSKPVALLYKKQELSVNDLRAAMSIERHVTLLEHSGLVAKQKSEKVGDVSLGHLATAERIQAAKEELSLWVACLGEISIPSGAVFDMLIDRQTMYYVDRRFRKSNGWSRSVLIKALKLWTELFFEGKD